MPKPLAIFDLDGTVFRKHWAFRVSGELARRSVPAHAKNAWETSVRMYQDWQHRKITYLDFEHQNARTLEAQLKGLPHKELVDAVRSVVESKKDRVHLFPAKLMEHLATTHTIAALTGCIKEVVDALQETYPIEITRTSIFAVEDGVLTGEMTQIPFLEKAALVQEILEEGGHPDGKGVIAIGDTMSDKAMLEAAEHPIAFNPTYDFVQHAEAQDWTIVTERKDLIHIRRGKEALYLDANEPLPFDRILALVTRA